MNLGVIVDVTMTCLINRHLLCFSSPRTKFSLRLDLKWRGWVRNVYEIPVAYPFYFSDYPDYTHVKTEEDGTSVAGTESDCVTYVFERKRLARKWILR